MSFFRFLISWKFWISLLIAALIVTGLTYYTTQKWLPQITQQKDTIKVPNLDSLNVYNAIKLLDDLDLKFKIDTVRYIAEYDPNQVIDYHPKAGTTVKKGRNIFIKANPINYRPVKVPELINNSKRLAFSKIKIADLKVGDTLYEPDLAKDVVLRVMFEGKQVEAGEKIPRFSKLDLVLGLGLQKDINTPKLIDLSLSEAEYVINQNFFDVGNTTFYPSAKTKEDSINAKVFYQDPGPKDIYDQGLPISIWLSTKPMDSLRKYKKDLDLIYRRNQETKKEETKRTINTESSSDNIISETINQPENIENDFMENEGIVIE